MAEPIRTFEIHRAQVAKYFYWLTTLSMIPFGLIMFGIGLIVPLVYALTFGHWLSRKQAEALDYRLYETNIFVHQGVFFIKRKNIPLDRVTDVVLAQGPLLRHFGLWRLDIQTAGSGQQRPEAYLYGLNDPEQIKETIINARDAIAVNNKQNPGF